MEVSHLQILDCTTSYRSQASHISNILKNVTQYSIINVKLAKKLKLIQLNRHNIHINMKINAVLQR